jgi:hypothetical protein
MTSCLHTQNSEIKYRLETAEYSIYCLVLWKGIRNFWN